MPPARVTHTRFVSALKAMGRLIPRDKVDRRIHFAARFLIDTYTGASLTPRHRRTLMFPANSSWLYCRDTDVFTPTVSIE